MATKVNLIVDDGKMILPAEVKLGKEASKGFLSTYVEATIGRSRKNRRFLIGAYTEVSRRNIFGAIDALNAKLASKGMRLEY